VNLLRAASTVSLLTLLSRVTGLVRDQLIAAHFGAGALTDAFNVAFRIPNLFRRLFAEGAFSQAFVPLLAATRERDGDAVTRDLVDAVGTVLAITGILFSIKSLGVDAFSTGFEVAQATVERDAQRDKEMDELRSLVSSLVSRIDQVQKLPANP
jgi:peptidoglycan biosynthesis protein MviN/MurJ (putative lipid II flippase)